MKLSHLDQAGRARMVDVGDKPFMDRTAVATGAIQMSRSAFQQVAEQAVAKGDVLAVSEVAGGGGGGREGGGGAPCLFPRGPSRGGGGGAAVGRRVGWGWGGGGGGGGGR